ncbi:uncharacterized protein B0P05DRAFT_553067 [Gilbertella persicaria]|uniref:uncharacterized protein n=1 Tax=Gilbertella persicaria TaxID=101096 RepID=UPI0022207AED|nr:uncharacterized protein B0P05DRAFT_553067 [Gilbertella persicaria]KAI8066978.1 hypothetical protein B0P05DRAFT_553067 [Gilbertella persicaria]
MRHLKMAFFSRETSNVFSSIPTATALATLILLSNLSRGVSYIKLIFISFCENRCNTILYDSTHMRKTMTWLEIK